MKISTQHTAIAILLQLITAFLFCHVKVSTLSFNPTSTSTKKIIALTRESGKNAKLLKTLRNHPNLPSTTNLIEIPCIKHSDGPDTERLNPAILQNEKYDFIILTSPEAASVFLSALGSAGNPKLFSKIAAVGAATEKALQNGGVPVEFVPSKATAKTLCVELPDCDSVLYPCSYRAATTIQDDLSKRGIKVERLNTYDTITNTFTDEQLEDARSVSVVCVGSPSAAAGWVENLSEDVCSRMKVACIGETSAKACRELGWDDQNIYFPEKPGVDGWADAVMQALAMDDKE